MIKPPLAKDIAQARIDFLKGEEIPGPLFLTLCRENGVTAHGNTAFWLTFKCRSIGVGRTTYVGRISHAALKMAQALNRVLLTKPGAIMNEIEITCQGCGKKCLREEITVVQEKELCPTCAEGKEPDEE